MTTCAARIVPGTTQADDRDIVRELRMRYDYAIVNARGSFDPKPTIAKSAYRNASLAYHAKWTPCS